MMEIKDFETEIIGHWIFRDGKMFDDPNVERVNWLIKNYLVRIGADKSGWLKLYKDPQTGKLWEYTYLEGELQGGGPPSLKNITLEVARKKYSLDHL